MNSLVAVNWPIEVMTCTRVECTFALGWTDLLEFPIRVICRTGPRYVFLICGDLRALGLMGSHDLSVQFVLVVTDDNLLEN